MAESVRDYPRPPRVEASSRRIRVELGGEVIVDTTRTHRVLEQGHPPVYYISSEDVAPGALAPSDGRTTYCEWKGTASYFDVKAGSRVVERGAWTYREPLAGFEEIRNAIAFYPGLMGACFVDGERVDAQPGGYYGGWITSDIELDR
jgi:uncharacterized protein (DUF427 family)